MPLLRNRAAIGTISVRRTEVRPFTRAQIDLLKTFADQAVIAIENVRLFNETKEALERQTATAEILKVIASSPAEVQPVFDAIVQTAKRLIGAFSATVTHVGDGMLHLVAHTATTPEGAEALNRFFPIPVEGTPMGRAIQSRRPQFVDDFETDPDIEDADRELARSRGFRSVVFVPLMRDDVAIGSLNVTRREAGRLTDHQLDLLKTFADQAVIAIENVRLFNETKEALERQTATAEILEVDRELADRRAAGVRRDPAQRREPVRRRDRRDVPVRRQAGAPGRDVQLVARGAARTSPDGLSRRRRAPTLMSGRTILAQVGRHARRTPRPTRITTRTPPRPGIGAACSACRCCARAGRSARCRVLARARRHAAAPGRPAADLRRPGGDRDRERAPVQRDQGGAGAADGDGGDPEGHRELADRRAAGVRRDRAERDAADRRSLRRRATLSTARLLHLVALRRVDSREAMSALQAAFPMPIAGPRIGRGDPSRAPSHIEDVRNRCRTTTARAMARHARITAQCSCVPMLREGVAIGSICVDAAASPGESSPTSRSSCSRPSPTRR